MEVRFPIKVVGIPGGLSYSDCSHASIFAEKDVGKVQPFLGTCYDHHLAAIPLPHSGFRSDVLEAYHPAGGRPVDYH